jgi:hypothetical protein
VSRLVALAVALTDRATLGHSTRLVVVLLDGLVHVQVETLLIN